MILQRPRRTKLSPDKLVSFFWLFLISFYAEATIKPVTLSSFNSYLIKIKDGNQVVFSPLDYRRGMKVVYPSGISWIERKAGLDV